jgi:hypothetical protein
MGMVGKSSLGRKMSPLAWTVIEALLRSEAWSSTWVIKNEPATSLPNLVRALLRTESDDEAESLYKEINNTVIVQQSVFSSSRLVVPVLLTALAGGLQHPARPYVLRLLWHMVGGWTDEEEIERGDSGVARDVDEMVRDAKWLFVPFLFSPDEDERGIARSVLSEIGPEWLCLPVDGVIGSGLLSLPQYSYQRWRSEQDSEGPSAMSQRVFVTRHVAARQLAPKDFPGRFNDPCPHSPDGRSYWTLNRELWSERGLMVVRQIQRSVVNVLRAGERASTNAPF